MLTVKYLRFALAAMLILGATLGPVSLPQEAKAQAALQTFEKSPLTIQSQTGQSHAFTVELALTDAQKTQGLMFRRALAADAGMLFVYDSDREIAMWMYNTFIPLDMLFLAADGRVVHVHERAVPQSTATISSRQPARGVLELPGGTAARLGLKAGDRVIHPLLK